MSSRRIPTAAGSFYPSNPQDLVKSIERSFLNTPFGPGKLPGEVNNKSTPIKGVIVPHAGYSYSGMCAAHAYKRIKECDDYDLFIVLGFSHMGNERGLISTMDKDWMTPLGHAHVDGEFVSLLTDDTGIHINESAFESEHSIEVQLPFLQYLFRNEFKFVPISIPSGIDHKIVGQRIRDVIKKSGKKVCIIASSDFTHYGENFGYAPFRDHIIDNIRRLDKKAIEYIKTLDTSGFLSFIRDNDATICGREPIALIMEILNPMVNRIELVNYYTSGELMGTYEHSVSYASILFEKVGL